nr:CrcB family protein [Streptomyces sp. NBC_00899]
MRHPDHPRQGRQLVDGRGSRCSGGSGSRAGSQSAVPRLFAHPQFAGCAAVGMLMAALHGLPRAPVWGGPVLGSGGLGGFTTFSTFATGTQRLIGHGHVTTGLLYAVATVAGALAACGGGRALTARLLLDRPGMPPS